MTDTHPEAERQQIELLRKAGARTRLALGLRMSEEAIYSSRRELKRLHPKWTDAQVGILWVRVHYGEAMARRLELFLTARNTAE